MRAPVQFLLFSYNFWQNNRLALPPLGWSAPPPQQSASTMLKVHDTSHHNGLFTTTETNSMEESFYDSTRNSRWDGVGRRPSRGPTHWQIHRGGAIDARLLSVQFLSFSCSFKQTFCQIIGWLHHLWGQCPFWKILDPPLQPIFCYPPLRKSNKTETNLVRRESRTGKLMYICYCCSFVPPRSM